MEANKSIVKKVKESNIGDIAVWSNTSELDQKALSTLDEAFDKSKKSRRIKDKLDCVRVWCSVKQAINTDVAGIVQRYANMNPVLQEQVQRYIKKRKINEDLSRGKMMDIASVYEKDLDY